MLTRTILLTRLQECRAAESKLCGQEVDNTVSLARAHVGGMSDIRGKTKSQNPNYARIEQRQSNDDAQQHITSHTTALGGRTVLRCD